MKKLLSTKEAGERLGGFREQTLRLWRLTGEGPPFVRFGGPRGRVRYREEDLEAWVAERVSRNTSEETVRANAVVPFPTQDSEE